MTNWYEKYSLVIFDWDGTLGYSSGLSEHLYPETLELIKLLSLEGKKLAIATGKGRDSLDAALTKFGIKEYFNTVCCADDFSPKPSPEMINFALSCTGFSVDSAIMVGDSLVDILSGKSAGVDTLLINRNNTEVLYDPTYVLDNFLLEK